MSQLFVKWKQIMSRVSWAQTPREARDSRKWVTGTDWGQAGALWKYLHKLINTNPNQPEAELPFPMAGDFSCRGVRAIQALLLLSAVFSPTQRSIPWDSKLHISTCHANPSHSKASPSREEYSASHLLITGVYSSQEVCYCTKIERIQCLQGRSSWVCTWVAVTVGNTVRLRHKLELYDKKRVYLSVL